MRSHSVKLYYEGREMPKRALIFAVVALISGALGSMAGKKITDG